MDLAIQFILQLAPIRATDDYAHALAYLIEYWEWDIDAYRSYLNPNIRADNTYIVLCALMLLAMVELMHLRYSGLTSEELQGRIRAIGPRTFAILAAIPRLGVIIIRIVEIVVIADSPAVACSLIVASMFPVIFPLILSGAHEIRGCIVNRRTPQRALERNGFDVEAITSAVTGRSKIKRTGSPQPINDDGIESSVDHNGHLHSSEGRSAFDPAPEYHA